MDTLNPRNRNMDFFEAGERQTLVTSRISGGVVGISQLRFNGCGFTPVSPPDLEDALLLHLHLRPQVAEISIDGRPAVPLHTPSGQINLLDFRRHFGGRIFKPFNMLGFHMPFSAFEALGPEYGIRKLDGVSLGPLDAVDDPQIRGLALALQPAFDHADQTNSLFLDHVGWALIAHVGQRYAEFSSATPGGVRPLASWQFRRASEMIAADLPGRVRLAELAAASGMPIGRFARAFKASSGLTPHEWLLRRRVERAKALLSSSTMPLSEVASECGFSDQSHMTRIFRRIVGASPGRWRRDS